MFHIQQLKHQYQDRIVLSVDEMIATQGEQILLKGSSGSGKTTLFHILAGLLKPTTGKVSIAGKDLNTLQGAALDQFRGQHIGMIFQETHLIKTLNVIDNLVLAQYMAGKAQDKKQCMSSLEKLNITHVAKQFPEQLSRGEAQRVVIARALLNQPSVILADEPTASLDDKNAEAVINLLVSQAQSQQATLFVSTHDSRVTHYFKKIISF
ncbi:MAG: ATP-binding cassette domain-containing protein [Thermoflexibacter sp.]|nr:ATP-binding cassette domain-containing protein [Thermoflexibacter sp.]